MVIINYKQTKMEREKISLSVSEQCDAVYGDSELYELIQSEVTGSFRHGDENEAVVQRTTDGKYFMIYYRDSCKDECGFEDLNDDGDFEEVFPVEKTITVYE